MRLFLLHISSNFFTEVTEFPEVSTPLIEKMKLLITVVQKNFKITIDATNFKNISKWKCLMTFKLSVWS